jgi:hypothetical protein
VLISPSSMALFLTLFMTIWFRRENARRDTISRPLTARELTVEQQDQERELADSVRARHYP